MNKIRDKKGKFTTKSAGPRKTKTIRVTDEVWKKFGKLADNQKISRADLLEIWIKDHVTHGLKNKSDRENSVHVSHGLIEKTIAVLTEALPLKSNAGGKIKIQVRKAIALLESFGNEEK